MRAIVILPLLLALAACEKEEEGGVAFVATRVDASTVNLVVENRSDGDAQIAACSTGVYTEIERWNGSAWLAAGFFNGPCDMPGDTGYGLGPGSELEWNETIGEPGRYRFAVLRVTGDFTNPDWEREVSNPVDF